MDIHTDTSVLSDELKPRRTPIPSSFGDNVPRPSVPDLSIIEVPVSSVAQQPLLADTVQPSMSHLTYSDWRQKVGGGNHSGSFSPSGHIANHHSLKSLGAFHSVKAAGSQSNNKNYVAYPCEDQQVRVAPGDQMGKVTFYNDLQKRPVTAPVVRTQQIEHRIGQDHHLSKSAPSSRVVTHHQHSDSRLAQNMHPLNQEHRSHQKVHLMPQPTNQNQFHGASSTHSGAHSVISNSNFNFSRKYSNGVPNQIGSVPLKSQTKNHINFNDSDSLSHCIPHPPGRQAEPKQCTSVCCQAAVIKDVGPWMHGECLCCASSAPIQHHLPTNHVHQMPPWSIQHISQCPQVSYDDLYKIVLSQNDQLKSLQAKVEQLLIAHDQRDASESSPKVEDVCKLPIIENTSCKRLVAEDGTQTSDNEPTSEESEKVSIGVMTSFIHAVTYRGRIGRVDTVHDVPEPESVSHIGQSLKQNRSSSSGDCSSSSSPVSKRTSDSCLKSSKDCSSKDKHTEKPKKQRTKIEKPNRNIGTKNLRKIDAACSEGCNCNNSGVSAAITAVRGCRAVLASRAGMVSQDFSLFNGEDLPTVMEQPASPVSSIHVDLQDYHSSSSSEASSSTQSSGNESDEDESTVKDLEENSKPTGWVCKTNVVGRINEMVEGRGVVSSNKQHPCYPPKPCDVSDSKRVEFHQPEASGNSKNLKEMAIKFLKENYPDELASCVTSNKTETSIGEKVQEMSVYNVPASNMSFATFRYLERYNLLPENFNPPQYLETATNMQGFHWAKKGSHTHSMPSGGGKTPICPPPAKSKMKSVNTAADTAPNAQYYYQAPVVPNRRLKRRSNPTPSKQLQPNSATSKILDITTLRQQPKLL